MLGTGRQRRMVSLGKVTAPKPVNLPSQRKENNGNDLASTSLLSKAAPTGWSTTEPAPSSTGASSTPQENAPKLPPRVIPAQPAPAWGGAGLPDERKRALELASREQFPTLGAAVQPSTDDHHHHHAHLAAWDEDERGPYAPPTSHPADRAPYQRRSSTDPRYSNSPEYQAHLHRGRREDRYGDRYDRDDRYGGYYGGGQTPNIGGPRRSSLVEYSDRDHQREHHPPPAYYPDHHHHEYHQHREEMPYYGSRDRGDASVYHPRGGEGRLDHNNNYGGRGRGGGDYYHPHHGYPRGGPYDSGPSPHTNRGARYGGRDREGDPQYPRDTRAMTPSEVGHEAHAAQQLPHVFKDSEDRQPPQYHEDQGSLAAQPHSALKPQYHLQGHAMAREGFVDRQQQQQERGTETSKGRVTPSPAVHHHGAPPPPPPKRPADGGMERNLKQQEYDEEMNNERDVVSQVYRDGKDATFIDTERSPSEASIVADSDSLSRKATAGSSFAPSLTVRSEIESLVDEELKTVAPPPPPPPQRPVYGSYAAAANGGEHVAAAAAAPPPPPPPPPSHSTAPTRILKRPEVYPTVDTDRLGPALQGLNVKEVSNSPMISFMDQMKNGSSTNNSFIVDQQQKLSQPIRPPPRTLSTPPSLQGLSLPGLQLGPPGLFPTTQPLATFGSSAPDEGRGAIANHLETTTGGGIDFASLSGLRPTATTTTTTTKTSPGLAVSGPPPLQFGDILLPSAIDGSVEPDSISTPPPASHSDTPTPLRAAEHSVTERAPGRGTGRGAGRGGFSIREQNNNKGGRGFSKQQTIDTTLKSAAGIGGGPPPPPPRVPPPPPPGLSTTTKSTATMPFLASDVDSSLKATPPPTSKPRRSAPLHDRKMGIDDSQVGVMAGAGHTNSGGSSSLSNHTKQKQRSIRGKDNNHINKVEHVSKSTPPPPGLVPPSAGSTGGDFTSIENASSNGGDAGSASGGDEGPRKTGDGGEGPLGSRKPRGGRGRKRGKGAVLASGDNNNTKNNNMKGEGQPVPPPPPPPPPPKEA